MHTSCQGVLVVSEYVDHANQLSIRYESDYKTKPN